MAVYPPRSKVEKKQTWNSESVFKNHKAWQDELTGILADIDSVKRFPGRLAEGPTRLLEALNAYEKLMSRGERVYMFAGFSYAVNTADQQAAGAVGKAASMFGQLAAAVAFISPEILSIGRERLDEWMKQE